MKPIVMIEGKVCFQDESGAIYEPHGVSSYRRFVPLGVCDDRQFITTMGRMRVKIEVTEVKEV